MICQRRKGIALGNWDEPGFAVGGLGKGLFATPKTKCLSIGIIIPVTHILQKSRFQIVNITIYDNVVYFAKCSAPNIPGYTTFQRQVATHLRSPPPNLQCQRQTYGNNRRMMLKLVNHIYIVCMYIYSVYI